MRNESDKSGELENYKNTHLMEKKKCATACIMYI